MITTNCPNCGAKMEFEEEREFCFCQFCGTKVFPEKTIVEHKGSVSVEGIATMNTALERADIFLNGAQFKDASIYYNKALDVDPKCSRAYWGLLLCKYKAQNDNQLIQNASCFSTNLTESLEYKNALKNSDEEQRKKMKSVGDKIKKAESEVSKKVNQLQTKISLLKNKNNRMIIEKYAGMVALALLCFLSMYVLFFSGNVKNALFWFLALFMSFGMIPVVKDTMNRAIIKNRYKIENLESEASQLLNPSLFHDKNDYHN